MKVCGGGGERNGCAVAARPNGPRRAIVRRVQKPPDETRRVAVAPTLAPRVSAQPERTSRDQIRASSNQKARAGKGALVLLPRIIHARYLEGLKIDLKAVNQVRKIVRDLNCCVIRQTRAHPSCANAGVTLAPTLVRPSLFHRVALEALFRHVLFPPSPNPAPSAAEPSPAARRPAPSSAAAVVPRRSTPAPARESPVPPPTTALGTLVGTPFRTHRTLPRDVSLTAALETGEALRAAGAQRRRASSALRASRRRRDRRRRIGNSCVGPPWSAPSTPPLRPAGRSRGVPRGRRRSS